MHFQNWKKYIRNFQFEIKRGRNSSLCMMPLKQTWFQSFQSLVSYFFMAGSLEVYVVFLYAFMIQAKIGVLLNAIQQENWKP